MAVVGEVVHRPAVAQVDVLDHTCLLKGVESAVDRGAVHSRVGAVHGLDQVVGGDVVVLGVHQRRHQVPAGCGDPGAFGPQVLEDRRRPVHHPRFPQPAALGGQRALGFPLRGAARALGFPLRGAARALGPIFCLLVVAGVTTACSKAAPSGGSAPARRIDGAPLETTAPGRPQRSERVLDVVATTSVVADWLRVVGGTNVRTRVIVKSGLDPTSYLATSADITTVQDADLVVAVGRGLEPWLDAVRAAAATDKPLVTITEGLPKRRTTSGADDPYLWLDPANAKQMVAAVTAALVSVDPAGEAAYAAARDRYATDLDQADEEARRVLGPVAGRGLVTAKETFGWFAARYGLELVGAVVPSLDGRADIPPRHLAALRQAVRTKQVAAVFAEASVPDDSVRRLAEDAGIKAVIGPDALLGDGLGPAGTPTDTFLGAFAHNVRSIATHLA